MNDGHMQRPADHHAHALAWFADNPGIDHVNAAVCDLNGVVRGKRLPRSRVDKVFQDGLRMPRSAFGVDVWGCDVADSPLVFETGDADGVCWPTERGPVMTGWSGDTGAFLPLTMSDEAGIPFAADPRQALSAMVARCAAAGFTPVVATELEFYLVDPADGIPQPPVSPQTGRRIEFDEVLSVDELGAFEHVLSDVFAACAVQDIGTDTTIGETGLGQFEINLQHRADAVRMADDTLLFKRIVKAAARRHGLAATFMAKPYGDRSGSGFHVHLSLLDRDRNNVFDDGSDQGSQTLRHAIGGLLEAMPENHVLFAPHATSYRRLRPGGHAPAASAWAYDNRTAALRVPSGPSASRRIEHRVAGADANPYLVIAAILGGILDGVERALEPPDPISGNAYEQDLPVLPADWASALAAFEAGPVAGQTFPPLLRTVFAAAKRQEMARFATDISPFEHRTYLSLV